MPLKARLTALAMQAGAQRVGFAKATEVKPEVKDAYRRWIDRGNHGEMSYMQNHRALRNDPRLLDENSNHNRARTVMVCAFSYYHPERQAPAAAKFAMYAHGSDYHEVLRKRLTPVAACLEAEGHSARICVDSAPVMERYWAQQAGVGFQGRNGLIIIPDMGSYFFLAEIITSAPITPDEPCFMSCDGCGRCTACCPGGALRTPGGFDARRCLSYLTIEFRGELPQRISANDRTTALPLSEALGQRVYGCDECQRVCPHNSNPPLTEIEEFRMRPALRTMTRDDIIAMTQQEFSTIFTHSAVKRVKLAGLRRNALAQAGPSQAL